MGPMMLDTSINASVRLMPSIKERDNFTTHNTRVMELPPCGTEPEHQAGSARQVDSFTTSGVMELPTTTTLR